MREDWEELILKDVLLSKNNIKWDSVQGNREYIDLSSVDRDTLQILETSTINSKNAPSRAKQIIHEGDILFGTTRPQLKRVTIVPSEYHNQICSTGFTILRSNSNRVLSEFIFYLLQSEAFMEEMSKLERGTSYPAVTDKDVKGFQFYLPPLPEQKLIVAMLDEVFEAIDQARANIERNIENAEELFQSKLNEIFSQRGEGWEEESLKKISKIMYGYTDKSSTEFSGPKYLRITDIQDNNVYWDNVPHCHPMEDEYEKYQLHYGDIVFARTGATTGKSYLVTDPPEAVFASYLIRVQADLDLLKPDFLYWYFQSPKYWRVINEGISGSAQGGFNATKLGKLHIPIPPTDIQDQIVEEVNDLYEAYESLTFTYRKKLDGIEELKKSILQEAFSGELTGGESGFTGFEDEQDGVGDVCKAAEAEVEYGENV